MRRSAQTISQADTAQTDASLRLSPRPVHGGISPKHAQHTNPNRCSSARPQASQQFLPLPVPPLQPLPSNPVLTLKHHGSKRRSLLRAVSSASTQKISWVPQTGLGSRCIKALARVSTDWPGRRWGFLAGRRLTGVRFSADGDGQSGDGGNTKHREVRRRMRSKVVAKKLTLFCFGSGDIAGKSWKNPPIVGRAVYRMERQTL